VASLSIPGFRLWERPKSIFSMQKIAFFGGANSMRVELLSLLFKAGFGIAGEITGVLVFGQEGAVLVRTGDDAITAAYAFVLIYHHDTVRSFGGSLAGQTSTQGASLHWLQRTGTVETSGP